ncbi:MAG: metallopeptidase family protein [Verrucomicrobia bacterium]|nr:metallopeptidase family protein [Verrucomicrobiota bacterium]
MNLDWDRLCELAQEEVAATLEALPDTLREQAEKLPLTLERTPGPDLVADGIAPDTLGLFVGPDFAEEGIGASPMPPQIILYLANLWDLAEQDEEFYLEEVHTTFLHELGHYLGLDEDELFERGLE